MPGDERPRRRIDDTSDKLNRRLRALTAIVSLVLLVVLVLFDNLGRLFIDPNFRISDFIFGTLAGVLALSASLEGLNRLPKIGLGGER